MKYLRDTYVPQGKVELDKSRELKPITEPKLVGPYTHYNRKIAELKTKWNLGEGLQVEGLPQKADEVNVEELSRAAERQKVKGERLMAVGSDSDNKWVDKLNGRLWLTVKI